MNNNTKRIAVQYFFRSLPYYFLNHYGQLLDGKYKSYLMLNFKKDTAIVVFNPNFMREKVNFPQTQSHIIFSTKESKSK